MFLVRVLPLLLLLRPPRRNVVSRAFVPSCRCFPHLSLRRVCARKRLEPKSPRPAFPLGCCSSLTVATTREVCVAAARAACTASAFTSSQRRQSRVRAFLPLLPFPLLTTRSRAQAPQDEIPPLLSVAFPLG